MCTVLTMVSVRQALCVPFHTVLELEKRESVCMPYMRRADRLGVARLDWPGRFVYAAREKVVLISVFETRGWRR